MLMSAIHLLLVRMRVFGWDELQVYRHEYNFNIVISQLQALPLCRRLNNTSPRLTFDSIHAYIGFFVRNHASQCHSSPDGQGCHWVNVIWRGLAQSS